MQVRESNPVPWLGKLRKYTLLYDRARVNSLPTSIHTRCNASIRAGLKIFLIWVLSFVYKHSARSRIECASTELCHHSIPPTSRVLSWKSGPREALEGFSQRSISLSPFVWLLAPTSYLLPYQSTLSAPRTPHAFTSAYSGVMH